MHAKIRQEYTNKRSYVYFTITLGSIEMLKPNIVVVFPFDPYTVNDSAAGSPRNFIRLIDYLIALNINTYLIGLKKPNTKLIKGLKLIPIDDKEIGSFNFFIKLFLITPFLKLPKNTVITASHILYLLPFIVFHPSMPKVYESIFENFEAFKSESKPYVYKITKTIYDLLEYFLLRNIKLIIVSPRYISYYETKYPCFKNKLICMFHESVDLTLFKPMSKKGMRIKHGIEDDDKIILHLSSINRKKRQHLSICSLKMLHKEIPDAKLIFVGPIGEKKYYLSLMNLIRELNLEEYVVFLGSLPYEEIPELINCADVNVTTSISETGPLTLLESFACGTPVVSTNVGLVPWVILNEDVGIIVNDDVKEISRAIIKMINQKQTKKIIMERRKISSKFDVENNQRCRLKVLLLALKT